MVLFIQTWNRLLQDYQGLYRQLEAVEGSTPTVGLVEETEEKLADRISLYQVGHQETALSWFPG